MRRPHLTTELTPEDLRGVTLALTPTGRDEDGAVVYETAATFRWWWRAYIFWRALRHARIAWR